MLTTTLFFRNVTPFSLLGMYSLYREFWKLRDTSTLCCCGGWQFCPKCVRPDGDTNTDLTVSQLMFHICGVSKTFGDWYQKTNRTEDTNTLTLLAFKIIAILHNTRLATFIKLHFRGCKQIRAETELDFTLVFRKCAYIEEGEQCKYRACTSVCR
jgi:hypothetical protein